MVELQPSKLVVEGSNPFARSIIDDYPDERAAVAQSVEHFLGKEEVMGSIPISSSIF